MSVNENVNIVVLSSKRTVIVIMLIFFVVNFLGRTSEDELYKYTYFLVTDFPRTVYLRVEISIL